MKLHSITGLITNSSTVIFTLEKTTPNEIYQILLESRDCKQCPVKKNIDSIDIQYNDIEESSTIEVDTYGTKVQMIENLCKTRFFNKPYTRRQT